MNKTILTLLLSALSTEVMASDIVFVHSYHLDYPWVKEYRDGFLATIKSNSIREYHMDTKRKKLEEFDKIADETWQLISEEQPKLLVIADDNALKLLGSKINHANIPVIFLGINANPRHYIKLNKKVSGALERPLLKRSVMMLKSILPDISKIKVLMDSNPTSYAILETSFDDKFNQNIAGTQIDIKLQKNFVDWKVSVTESKDQQYDAIIVANYAALSDKSGNNISLDEVSEWTSQNSTVPMFAFWSYSIGKGKAIGGLTISGTQQGIEAANKANQFFATGTLPSISTPSRGQFVFSEYELNRWDIKLPSNIDNKSILLD
ncbi:ABC transporter substrate-binding protein [Shewanella sp. UCD-KL12]|uniref:ABC transporter substrate-binding protein n=1 Tax=Shewanella sp. UCD-KL12 TaxID=1917163 RepID=UPI0009711ED3|nr:hypothetical protein [Shewanella sp. UCD-KL12]